MNLKKKRRHEDEEEHPVDEIHRKKIQKKAALPSNEKVTTLPVSHSDDPYSSLDPVAAAEIRKEDEEIADLEAKLGIGNKKERDRLNREYAKLEGYGEDFGDFLHDLDDIATRVTRKDSDYFGDTLEGSLSEDEEEDSEAEEEAIPMKGPCSDDDDNFNSEEEGSEENDDSDEETASSEKELDHCTSDTYQPRSGEDIYGREVDPLAEKPKANKYVPPHLRKTENSDDQAEKLRALQRLLNNALNRLSEDTMISVAQSLAQAYESYPTADANEYIWKNISNAAIDKPTILESIIPVYVASLSGVHLLTGDTVQLGGYLIEQIITKLWKIRETKTENEEAQSSKVASNLILCVCYMYNFGLIHSVFMFDIVRSFINSFSELDIELILLILSHSGYSLRSDDPLALKEIVLAVDKQHSLSSHTASTSRVEFMISSMTNLKNNKRRKQDMVYNERTSKLRKFLGRIKVEAFRSSDSTCLRIRLDDILNVETKGRWWKVGASWIGNQYQKSKEEGTEDLPAKLQESDEEEEELLKLASKCRMNTDSRRSIFCIIMGSSDCDDAFEKLVRAGMLKNRCERDCVRVLMECCGAEKKHNPFYSHLASRICEYQPQCKFSFQLAFWDMFKQWNAITHRKASNLSKLLFHLVAVKQNLKMNVLKTLDTEDMEETPLIFLTIFFSNIFESIEDKDEVSALFEQGLLKRKTPDEEEDRLRESLSVFFLLTLKMSPKNKKNSRFRTNLKAAMKACETNELDTMVVK